MANAGIWGESLTTELESSKQIDAAAAKAAKKVLETADIDQVMYLSLF